MHGIRLGLNYPIKCTAKSVTIFSYSGQKTEFTIFIFCRCSLFLKDPFFSDYLEVATAVSVLTHRYSVVIF